MKRNNNNKRNKRNKRRTSKASALLRKMNYQETSGTQTLGPGIMVKNYEMTIPCVQSQMGTFTLDAILGEQWQEDFGKFTYFKIIALAVIQQKVNNTNSFGTVSVLFNFNRSIEGDILTNDSTKVFPPFGSRHVVYRPNSGIVYVTKTVDNDTTNRPMNLSVFNATSNVLISQVYHLPGQLVVYSTASGTRFLKVVLRVVYRGSFEDVGSSKLQVETRVKEIEEMVKNGVTIKYHEPRKTLALKEIEKKQKGDGQKELISISRTEQFELVNTEDQQTNNVGQNIVGNEKPEAVSATV